MNDQPAQENAQDLPESSSLPAHDGRESLPSASEPDKPKKRLSKRAKFILLSGLLLVIVGLVCFFLYHQARGKYFQSTDDAYLRADSVAVSARIAGFVEQVYVDDNQMVEAGQLLFRLDAREYNAQRAQFRAQIEAGEAAVENARAALTEQAAAISQAEAQFASSRQDADYAAAEVARYAPLAASGAETHEKLAGLQNKAVQSRTMATAQRAVLTAARLRQQTMKAQIAQAQAQVKTAQAQLEAAQVNVSSAEVRASVRGRVGDKQIRLGQFLAAGERIMSIVPETVYVTANFKETQIGLMRPGQPASIEIDALSGTKFQGQVESVAPATGAEFSLLPPQNATGNFTKIVQRVPVRLALKVGPQTRPLLVPGLSVSVQVDTLSARGDLSRRAESDAGQHP